MKVIGCTALDAAAMLRAVPETVLVDVRTLDEWTKGLPKPFFGKNQLKLISIMQRCESTGEIVLDLDFISQVQLQTKTMLNLIFLCRSGKRSKDACDLVANFGKTSANLYNVLDGFSGSFYGPGWTKSNLPVYSSLFEIS